MKYSGVFTGGGDIEEHGVQSCRFGGHDEGTGDDGQDLKASARESAC